MVTGTIWKHIGIFLGAQKKHQAENLGKSAKIPATTINNHKGKLLQESPFRFGFLATGNYQLMNLKSLFHLSCLLGPLCSVCFT